MNLKPHAINFSKIPLALCGVIVWQFPLQISTIFTFLSKNLKQRKAKTP